MRRDRFPDYVLYVFDEVGVTLTTEQMDRRRRVVEDIERAVLAGILTDKDAYDIMSNYVEDAKSCWTVRFYGGIVIKIEMQIPPILQRDSDFWADVARLAATKTITFRSSHDVPRRVTYILASDGESTTKAEIQDTELCLVDGFHKKQIDVVKEAIRFAAWQLVHNSDTEELEDDD